MIKATKAGQYGARVHATPASYLQRLLWQNNELGDDIRFLGAVQSPNGEVTLFTDQPIYDGTEPTNHEIEHWFARQGYVRYGATGFYNGSLVVDDAAPRNVKKMADGSLRPFDVIVREPGSREEDRLDSIHAAAVRDPLSKYHQARQDGNSPHDESP